jgi:serine/threonine-protein kinase HipA
LDVLAHLPGRSGEWPGRIWAWRLSPAYDLNPVPTDVKPRILSTAIDFDDRTASLSLAMDVADYFGLQPAAAKQIAGEVGRAVASWREEASRLELPKQEIERMASAFEHDDLRVAAAVTG